MEEALKPADEAASAAPREKANLVSLLENLAEGLKQGASRTCTTLAPFKRSIVVCGILAAALYGAGTHLPFQTVNRGDMGLRINQWTGGIERFQEGTVLVFPGIHEMRAFSLRDQVYHPVSNDDRQSFQSIEGLTVGVDFTVRYALDPEKIPTVARILPENIDDEVVLPIVQDALHRTLSRYTVREIFSTRRQEIQEGVTKDLQARLKEEGIKLKLLTIGKIDLPNDYKVGMEKLMETELETERMRYTLDLKDKQVKESELVALADKVRREKAAEAAGEEQIIAAKAQAEAMRHILPFKEKQIKQRELEAEADKVARLKSAQAEAEARIIEATAEADSRKKLAEAEAFRLEQIGKVNSDQMAREGVILAQSPLLIQKSLADKLSDKISIIIAPPGANGGFIGENLIGRLPAPTTPTTTNVHAGFTDTESSEEE
ncbi:MAG: prohibitin family protein [Zoogloeaceae bacterium]|jgi:regulator of protease activity HflC (stomatin/prohibitin superfamily)|nr:prohibitin family protein [Zoogloeaceae bacterium]